MSDPNTTDTNETPRKPYYNNTPSQAPAKPAKKPLNKILLAGLAGGLIIFLLGFGAGFISGSLSADNNDRNDRPGHSQRFEEKRNHGPERERPSQEGTGKSNNGDNRDKLDQGVTEPEEGPVASDNEVPSSTEE